MQRESQERAEASLRLQQASEEAEAQPRPRYEAPLPQAFELGAAYNYGNQRDIDVVNDAKHLLSQWAQRVSIEPVKAEYSAGSHRRHGLRLQPQDVHDVS